MLPVFENSCAGHPCKTLLWDILVEHFCLTFFLTLLKEVIGPTCRTLLLDALAIAGHSCQTLILDTLDRTLLLDTLDRGHSCLTLLLDTLARHSCWTLFARHSFLTLFPRHSWRTLLTGHSCLTLLLPKRAFSTRPSPKVNPPKQAFSTRLSSKKNPPKRAFSTRPVPKVTIQASKTSVLHETSRKSKLQSKHCIANPDVTARFNTYAKGLLSRNPPPLQRNASPFLHDMPLLRKSQCNGGANWHMTHPWKVTFQSSPHAIGIGFQHLPTVADTKTTSGENSSTLRLPS